MKNPTKLSIAATAAAAVGLALSARAPASAQTPAFVPDSPAVRAANHMPSTWTPHEACFGINAAGKNDCRTADIAGPRTDMTARDPKAFVDVPTGVCAKIEGGFLKPKPAKPM